MLRNLDKAQSNINVVIGFAVTLITVVTLGFIATGIQDEYAVNSDSANTTGSAHKSKGNASQAGYMTVQGRPTDITLPDDAVPANAAAIEEDPAGQLELAYTGSDQTTAQFAVSTHDVFIENYRKTGHTNGDITVHSTETGQDVAMHCTDDGSIVTCQGDDGEKVYIA